MFSQGDFDDSEMELVGEFSVAELDEHIQKCEDYLDLSFEYIKNIELKIAKQNNRETIHYQKWFPIETIL